MSLKPILEIEGLSHSRNGVPVLNDINLKIIQGETVAIVGPSGSGKSTLLDILMGTISPTQGEIYVDNVKVVEPSRDRGIVYQKYTLLDHETVEMNVAIGPILEKTNLPQRFLWSLKDKPIKFLRKLRIGSGWKTLEDPYLIESHVWLSKVGLSHAATRYPSQLSGGMQQRCAIAQCMIMRPKILLMDEPFGALDPKTRHDCQRIMLDIAQENIDAVANDKEPPVTVIFVTHDRAEAIKIADRVIAISQFHPDGENGATIVFDAATPNFDPKNPVTFDFPKAMMMEEDITAAAMDPMNNGVKKQFHTFWRDVELGSVKGIFAGKKMTF
jgi:NitT/TauT family transport system ATP-binding protein